MEPGPNILHTEYGADGEALGSIRLPIAAAQQHHVAVACIQPFYRLPSGQTQLFYDANNNTNIYNTITSYSSAIQNIWFWIISYKNYKEEVQQLQKYILENWPVSINIENVF